MLLQPTSINTIIDFHMKRELLLCNPCAIYAQTVAQSMHIITNNILIKLKSREARDMFFLSTLFTSYLQAFMFDLCAKPVAVITRKTNSACSAGVFSTRYSRANFHHTCAILAQKRWLVQNKKQSRRVALALANLKTRYSQANFKYPRAIRAQNGRFNSYSSAHSPSLPFWLPP